MSKTKVLVVEDEKIVALDIQKQLTKSGYEVCGLFGSGEEALDVLDHNLPDIVLMDIQLQGKLDGVETAGIIKKEYGIPVIFLTAYADDLTVQRAKYIEPFGYITKPFEERGLRTTIEMAMYKHIIDKQLHESEEKYRNFFEEDLSGDFISNPDGTIIVCNQAFINILKIPDKKTVIGENINKFFPNEESQLEFWNALDRIQAVKLKEFNLVTSNGSLVTVLANVVGTYEQGKLVGIKGYLLDISQRKELEEQLRHAQKMEAVGRLAGGIAHDFNNILTVMLGYSSVMREKIVDEEDIRSELDHLQHSINRAIKLTKQLLVFSRKEVLNPQILDINDITKNLAKMLKRLISENISIQFFLDSLNPYIFIDPGQLEQILINLVVNGKDAMRQGGRIVIQTENVDIKEEQSAANGVIPIGKYVKISVSDTGSGIETVHIPKIFEPFFTTKPQGEGTGLGLSIVYGIVNQNKGFISVQSREVKGTEFIILFHEQESAELTISQDMYDSDITVAGETILIVEDDENVRGITGSILRRKGYNVVEAKNGGEAILLCEKNEKKIDLILADYILPIINGDELAERLIRMIPALKVVLMTGDPDFGHSKKTIQGNSIHILKKPFELRELISTINETLHN